MPTLVLPPSDQKYLTAITRQDFATFVRRSAMTLSPGVLFHDNWHLHAIAYALEQVRTGQIRRLIINVPPRSLKSITASVAFPAFVLGKDPTQRLICVSYSSELAEKHANDCRAILSSRWYQNTFPNVKIARATTDEITTSRHGSRLTTSVSGTLTGRGGNIVIIDDPLKPADALSESRRSAVNSWYVNTLQSRLDDKRTGAIVIVMQRLHVDDLVGLVTRDSDEWHVLNFPAIAVEDQTIQIERGFFHHRKIGDVLHPEREPLSILESLRSTLGSDTFNAQYQQQPMPPGGAMIKRRWISRYRDPPPLTDKVRILQSWDTAVKGGSENDWSVCTTWMVIRPNFYLIDVHRGRYDYPDLRQRALLLAKRFKPDRILIEDAGTGSALIAEMRRMGQTATPIRPVQDKVTRMSIESAKFESGFVFLPEQAPWLTDYEGELFSFPNSRFDDQVDSTSQALANGVSRYNLDAVG